MALSSPAVVNIGAIVLFMIMGVVGGLFVGGPAALGR
jgi:hypothetical protein